MGTDLFPKIMFIISRDIDPKWENPREPKFQTNCSVCKQGVSITTYTSQVGTTLSYLLGYGDTLFLATIGAGVVTQVPSRLVFDEIRLNPGGHYDGTTGIYTVPIDGIYEFNVNVRAEPDRDFGFALVADGVDVAFSRNADGSGLGKISSLLVIPLHATAGQQFWVRPWDLNAIYGRVESDGNLISWFAGRLISAD